MPEKQTLERAERDKRQGKAPSTQAGEFVKEEIEHVREGKHGARSTKRRSKMRQVYKAEYFSHLDYRDSVKPRKITRRAAPANQDRQRSVRGRLPPPLSARVARRHPVNHFRGKHEMQRRDVRKPRDLDQLRRLPRPADPCKCWSLDLEHPGEYETSKPSNIEPGSVCLNMLLSPMGATELYGNGGFTERRRPGAERRWTAMAHTHPDAPDHRSRPGPISLGRKSWFLCVDERDRRRSQCISDVSRTLKH